MTDKKYEWKYFDTEIFSRTCNYYEWLLSADNGDVTCDYVTETIKIFNIVYRCLWDLWHHWFYLVFYHAWFYLEHRHTTTCLFLNWRQQRYEKNTMLNFISFIGNCLDACKAWYHETQSEHATSRVIFNNMRLSLWSPGV